MRCRRTPGTPFLRTEKCKPPTNLAVTRRKGPQRAETYHRGLEQLARLVSLSGGRRIEVGHQPAHDRHVYHEPEPDCWLHPDVEVRSSLIAGDGLFARAPIPAGTLVSRLGGRLVSWPELRDMFRQAAQQPDHPYINSITVTSTLHLVLPPGRANGKGNHSCDPNLWWVDTYTLAARRDIDLDEELTNDYATSTASAEFAMACRCCSALCRGVVTGSDWQLTELRDRYGEHWVPVLTRLIADSESRKNH
jgi:uncharacterized protein